MTTEELLKFKYTFGPPKSRGEVEWNHSESLCVLACPSKWTRGTCKQKVIWITGSTVGKSNLWAVVAIEALRHHGLCAAGAFRGLSHVLVPSRSHHQKNENDEEHGEEKTYQDSYYQDKPVITRVHLIKFSRNDTLRLGILMKVGMFLSAAVQRYV